jgi:sorting nexin-8
MYSTLEALKVGVTQFLQDCTHLSFLQAQRDLYLALRELFIRHDKQSGDQVDKLRKKAEATALKMEGVRAAQKEGWQQEADRLASTIEKDQATIALQLQRRVFIRAWYASHIVWSSR